MIPQEAIEKAKNQGWQEPFVKPLDRDLHQILYGQPYPVFAIALDKTFWQALGKALGWKAMCNVCRKTLTENCFIDHAGTTAGLQWMIHAHRFYDLILTEQPTDAFWNELLAN